MPDDFEEQPQDKPDLRQYWKLARRRWWYFVLPMFLGWLLVYALGWMLPSVYRSGTLILVEKPTVPRQYVEPNVSSSLQDQLNSITQQILSRTRLLHIIDTLSLYQNDKRRLSPDELVDRMRKDIGIELVKSESERDQLTAFNVYFSSRDPHVAQMVTNELTNLFINKNLEVRQQQSESTTQFLQSQLGDARGNLAEQEKRLREYKDRHLGELPGQLQSNLEILAGLQGQLQAEQDDMGRARQQNAYLQSLLTQYRSISLSSKTGNDAPADLPAITQELQRLREQLAKLTAHYTDRHPDVRKLKEQIANAETLKRHIAAELEAKATDTRKDQSPDGTTPQYADDGRISPTLEIRSQLRGNEIEIANRQQSIQVLQGKIAEYQSRLNQTPVREQQLADISRDYEQSKTNYESLLAKKNQSELATNLEKRQEGEHFRILDPPSLPVKPYSPDRLKLSLIGIMVGLGLGTTSVIGATLIDDHLYTEKDLKNIIPAVILGEIPPLFTSDEDHIRQRTLWRDLLGASAALVCMLAGVAIAYYRG